MEKLRKDRPAVSTEDYQIMGSVPGPHITLESVSQDSPADITGLELPCQRTVMREKSFKGQFPVALFCLKVPRTLDPQKVSQRTWMRRLRPW